MNCASVMLCFVLVMSNHQASNICDQLPAVKQPNVSEPGDLARLEMRGPAGAGEGRRGGTGDGGRGATGATGSEERRVKSDRRGPDIRRPLDVPVPVGQSAGGGEMRRDRRARPDDPEPGVGRHTRGDGEGTRIKVMEKSKPTGIAYWRNERTLGGFASSEKGSSKISASETVKKLRSTFGNQPPPALSKNKSPGSCEGFVTTSGHFIQRHRAPTFSTEQSRHARPVTKAEKKRDSVSIVEGFWKLQAEMSANRESHETVSMPRFQPIGRDPRQTGKWTEDTDQRSGPKETSKKVHLEQPKKTGNIGPRSLSDFNQSSFVSEFPPISIFVPENGSLPEEKRAEKASVLVGHINRLSRQKKGGLFDVEVIASSDHCPLCGDLNGVCLGVSCRKKGK